LDGTKDDVKLLVGTILIQPYLEIRRRTGSGEINCAPFDVKDAIGSGARYGRKYTACAAREIRAAGLRIGAEV
jgi:hypothetical protein